MIAMPNSATAEDGWRAEAATVLAESKSVN
jgi:hypothetical protein